MVPGPIPSRRNVIVYVVYYDYHNDMQPCSQGGVLRVFGDYEATVMTMNAWELRHFFSQRLDKAAQWEIRAVATEMLSIVKRVAPKIFEDIAVPQ